MHTCCKLLLCCMLAVPALAQLPSPIVSEDVVQVTPHVHMITGFPNIAFVVGDNATLAIDTGLGPEQGATVARIAQRLARGPKLYLTTTHFHPEHAAGEAGFPAQTIIVRAKRQQKELDRDGPAILNQFKGFNANYGRMLENATMRPPDITFDEEITLDLGGVTVRLFWFGPGHTEGDELILADAPGERVLISGDIVQNKVVPSVPVAGGSLENWIQILRRIEQLYPFTVVPTHSRVGNGNMVTESREFIEDMRGRALRLRAEGVPVAQAQTRLVEEFRRDYPEWAANTDWNNVGTLPGFVQRVYTEAAAH